MHMSCLPVSLYAALSAGETLVGGRLAAELGLTGGRQCNASGGPHAGDAGGSTSPGGGVRLRIAMLVAYSDFTQTDARSVQRQTLERHIDGGRRRASFCAPPQGRRTPA